MFVKYFSSLVLVALGFMDCLTTVVGTMYFGTQELNPLIAGLVDSNLLGFIALKLAVTVSAGLIFVLVEKVLQSGMSKNISLKAAYKTLRVACFFVILFLAFVVINNIIVILNATL